jgi:plasmid stability protein
MPREWTSQPPGTKAVRLNLADAVHAKLRIIAAEHGVAMSVFVRQVVEDLVRARYPEVFTQDTSQAEGEPAAEVKPTAKKPRKRKT